MTKSRKKEGGSRHSGTGQEIAHARHKRKPALFKAAGFMERHSHLSNLPPVPAQTFYGLHLPQGL